MLLILTLAPVIAFCQADNYTITSYLDSGFLAPNTHYIGEAWLNFLINNDPDLDYNITKATFKANSTLDWHKHSSPQVIIVVDGVGYYQERGKDPIMMKSGDVIKCSKDVEHWHSSSKDQDVTYVAIYKGETEWTEVLSQEEYDRVAKSFK